MPLVIDALRTQPIIYVTRDIERALGLPLTTPGYFIISNSTPFAKSVAAGHANVLLVENIELLDTHELLQQTEIIEFITKQNNPRILVFKNTSAIEKICAKHNWKLLNPSAELAQKVEDKISQIEWLGDLTDFLPEHKIHILKEVWFDGKPFIVQFNKAHTGNGTILIDSEKKLNDLKIKFPNRPVRATEYINGSMFTSNNIVTPRQILVGNINYQITGLAPFTDQAFATVGNDFGLANRLLSGEQKKQFHEMVLTIGKRLRAAGWKGLFGIDILLEKFSGKLFLIEINARQPASTVFESYLQNLKIKNEETKNALTTFEAHLMSLLAIDFCDNELIKIETGGQIILRNQNGLALNKNQLENIAQKLIAENFKVIPYTNTTPGSDLLRIQSERGIMENDKKFNEWGQKIVKTL